MVTKQCSRCKKEKPIQEFNFKFKQLGIRQKACSECTRLEVRNHYANNKQYYLLKAHLRNEKIRNTNRNYIWKYLATHPCVDCGEDDPIVLEFDHIRDKKFAIAKLILSHEVEDLESEIAKCEVRCSNCHKRKTAKQFGWYKLKMPL